jgi:mono/diheme cytochrome c family protein
MRRRNTTWRLIGGLALAASLPTVAPAQDAARGAELAKRWCVNCHVVERLPATAPADGLPTFPALANAPGQSADHLRAAMNPQHSRMPDFALGKTQQDDLVAYILSLRTR